MCLTYECKKVLIKIGKSYLSCVDLISCVITVPIYGHFMGSNTDTDP